MQLFMTPHQDEMTVQFKINLVFLAQQVLEWMRSDFGVGGVPSICCQQVP